MSFIDTSFFIALRNRRDTRHDEAARLWSQHADGRLVTTNHVVGETWTFLRRRAGFGAAVGFVESVERSSRIVVAHVSESVERAAWDWLRSRDDREFSFVDATSFVTMRSERIADVLAFDGDFTAAGFVELRA